MVDRRVEGTYQRPEGAVKAVRQLMNEEGYMADEILLIANEDQSYGQKLETLSPVEVDLADSSEDLSFIEKLKEMVSFGTYNSDEPHNALEEYGISEDLGEHFNEALEAGEIVLLVNSDAPRNISELSEVNQEVVEE